MEAAHINKVTDDRPLKLKQYNLPLQYKEAIKKELE